MDDEPRPKRPWQYVTLLVIAILLAVCCCDLSAWDCSARSRPSRLRFRASNDKVSRLGNLLVANGAKAATFLE